ncbi:putative ABC transporter ATP-binding protein [Actinoplanes philippinensis]|uniref:ABC-type multidrug transport system, ATPase and permease component n=1 Tax=Actinoplanes philippinensis TaxID=35752 RepID=A0A1I2JFF1_9ACTN|nr:ABC transporter ATP-binding protein [Actinoplanes philippinensis]GIE80017.1 putative ABC transporter ATP-binding protein [Actinoplanes philippinensis]SFF52828.1 ABC-type multidrug transport system, ATPase and permease component [Actinoplanes philippinensis]
MPVTPERLRILRELTRGRGIQVALIAILVLVSTSSSLAVPMLVGRLVAAIQSDEALLGLTGLLIATGLGTAAAGALATFLLGRMGQQLIYRLRVRTVDHSLRLRMADIRRQGSGNLAARLTMDAARLKALIDIGPVQLPMAGVTLLGTLIIMGLLDWVLLLVTLAAFAVAAAIVVIVVRRLRRTYQSVQIEVGGFVQRFVGVIDAITVIKANRAEPVVGEQLAESAARLRDLEIKAARMESLMVPVINLGQQIALAAVVIGGGARLLSGHLTLATFVSFLLYLLQLAAPLLMAASGVTGLQMGLAARERFDEIFALPREDRDDLDGAILSAPPVAPTAAVEFDQVTAGYDARPVLRDVSFAVPSRGLTAVVGLSGSGKSTALNLILRFLSAEQGRISVFGEPVQSWRLDRLRSEIAYVDQAATLLPDSIRTNLTLGSERPAGDAELRAALDRVGLLDEIGHLPDGLDTVLGGEFDLSGGQRQRLALARALISGSRLILLDEPTSHLDGVNEHRLREVVDELATDHAVLVVAHRLSTVRQADHVIVLDNGRVADQGSHHELLDRCERYTELVDAQALAHA